MATNKNRRSVPAPQSKLVNRGTKQVQRQDSLNRDDFESSLEQSVSTNHSKEAGSAAKARAKGNASRDRSTKLGKGVPSNPTV